jgi:hypothetical protein
MFGLYRNDDDALDALCYCIEAVKEKRDKTFDEYGNIKVEHTREPEAAGLLSRRGEEG